MSLLERFYPVLYPNYNFFDSMHQYMEREFANMERQMTTLQEHLDSGTNAMRGQMHQLLPLEPEGPNLSQIQPKVPIVQDKGETKLKLNFNLHGFKPDDVKVKILGNNLLEVSAHNETKTETGYSKSMFLRQYSLPDGVEVDKLKPTLTKDGVLTIEAPALLKDKERMIPIEYSEVKNGHPHENAKKA